MGEGNLVVKGLVFIFLFYIILLFVMSNFYYPYDITQDSESNGLVNFIKNGYELFGFEVNIFFFLGQRGQESLGNAVLYLSYLPSYILYPIIITITVMFAYAIIKLLPTT